MVYFKKIAYKGKYHDDEAIPTLVSYITNPEKTPSKIIYGVKVDMDRIADSMIDVAEKYKKNKRLRLHHFILSFDSKYGEELDLIDQVVKAVCDEMGKVYQIVAAVHEKTDNPHIHFAFNAVSFVNGYKYRGSITEYWKLVHTIEDILDKFDLFPVVPVKYRLNPSDPHE